jgi:hypothetical protein
VIGYGVVGVVGEGGKYKIGNWRETDVKRMCVCVRMCMFKIILSVFLIILFCFILFYFI